MTTLEDTQTKLQSILQSKCGACHICCTLLVSCRGKRVNILQLQANENKDGSNIQDENENHSYCQICLGICSTANTSFNFLIDVENAIRDAVIPYSGNKSSQKQKLEMKFHSDAPTLSLPSDLFVRAYAALSYLEHNHDDLISDLSYSPWNSMTKTEDYMIQIKEIIKSRLRSIIMSNSTIDHEENPSEKIPNLPNDEGTINIHIILQSSAILPPSHYFPVDLYPPPKKERKRFRGEDPTSKQGGSASVNLEKRIQKQLMLRMEKKQRSNENDNDSQSGLLPVPLSLMQRAIKALENTSKQQNTKDLEEWLINQVTNSKKNGRSHAFQIHVAAWRQPFYIKGRYSKNRRDVSQSPFYVMETIDNTLTSTDTEKDGTDQHQPNKKKTVMVRKGVTSVEEQICSVVSELACGGISTLNNYDSDDERKNDSSRGKIVYGMCKFHGSGREDVDVRMLGTGRPFVLEIIDAYNLPTSQTLLSAAQHLMKTNEPIYGVGIVDSKLSFGNAKNFSGLQSETENKVKHYGCMCWSERIIPSQEFLDFKLSHAHISADVKNDKNSNEETYNMSKRLAISRKHPLKLIQATPIRVLHRRSAANRTRYIVSMKSKRINDHWFQLWVSTSAGTYVKEFVRGDLGRTTPSIASMLSDGESTMKKVDILQLDVMGIEDSGFISPHEENDIEDV